MVLSRVSLFEKKAENADREWGFPSIFQFALRGMQFFSLKRRTAKGAAREYAFQRFVSTLDAAKLHWSVCTPLKRPFRIV